MNLETNDIKFKAFEASHYCPPYKEDNFIESFDMDTFDVEKAKDMIRKSVKLLSHSKGYRDLLIEILDVLDRNRYDFLADQQKYISFYWSGIPVLLIIINKTVAHDKQLHISLQKYKVIKQEKVSEKKTNRVIMLGLGGSLLIGGVIAGLALLRSRRE